MDAIVVINNGVHLALSDADPVEREMIGAVRDATDKVLWTHQYNSPDYGPNGVTML